MYGIRERKEPKKDFSNYDKLTYLGDSKYRDAGNHSFMLDYRKPYGLLNVLDKYLKKIGEDKYIINDEDIVKLMEGELKNNPFKESSDRVDYHRLMIELERLMENKRTFNNKWYLIVEVSV